ncbi:MAG TPA: PhoH family protein [Alphaproteobacteria bacterium]|nr:PhoH family protein [Alphaproteobacteria bacterium]
MSAVPDRKIQITFDDNRRLPLLYGEHNANLIRLERQMGVRLTAMGNVLDISGPKSSVESTRKLLASLWQRASADVPIGPAEIDAAMRLANSPDLTDDSRADVPVIRTRRRAVAARGQNQIRYFQAMERSELVLAVGPAGTGKTYLAVAQAVASLQSGRIDRIIISRPAVEAGERLGFLPGDLREKIDPYLRPIYDALNDLLPAEQVERRIGLGEIEIAPLAFMRGRTLSHAFVILDEAQNTTTVQMKMALTRLGEGSRMVVTGDIGQIDLPAGVKSGLVDAIETLDGVEGIEIVRFNDHDVVRLPVVARIIRAYAEAGKAKQPRKTTDGGRR